MGDEVLIVDYYGVLRSIAKKKMFRKAQIASMRKSTAHDFPDRFSTGIIFHLTINREKCTYRVLCLERFIVYM